MTGIHWHASLLKSRLEGECDHTIGMAGFTAAFEDQAVAGFNT